MLASVSSVSLIVTLVAAALFILCLILVALFARLFGDPYMVRKFRTLSILAMLVAIPAFLVFIVTRIIMFFVG